MPKLWTDTIQAHHQAVRDATLNTIAALVARHGVTAVTMSRIAEETGIGRATLYKHFPDVDAILTAWHERQVAEHLQQLTAVRDHAGPPAARLEAVLTRYADISYHRHDTELAALLHRGEHVIHAQHQLRDLIRDLLAAGAQAGDLRADVPPEELATYCLHALTAAGNLTSKAAVQRLVDITLSGLRRHP
ncbi:MAG: TetR/AcrR family transcriptional regulator [bacterium]